MQKLDKVRQYEAIFIFLATLIYLVRRYFEEEWSLKNKLTTAEVEAGLIYQEQDIPDYNHLLNTHLPIIGSAILLLAAWYMFHYRAFPHIKATLPDDKTLIYTLLTLILAGTGTFVYLYFRKDLVFLYDEESHIIGFATNSLYRQRNVASATVAYLTIIGYYECLAQLYYYIHLKLGEDQKNNHVYISYFLLACLASFFLGFALIGQIPDTFFNLPMQNLGKGGFQSLFYLLSMGVLVYILQKFCYERLLPSIHQSAWDVVMQHLAIYLISCFAGSSVIWVMAHDFEFGWLKRGLGVLLTLLITPLVITYLRQAFTKEKIQLETQISHKSAELIALRMQINPHFLFNALNTLYAAALRENAEKTSDGIQKLGDMMRFMLHENNQERIPLSKETEYLYNYIAIQRMRLDESHPIEIRVNIQEPDKDIYIAPMLLNPFVENAFKHGISFRQTSWIYITLTMDATQLYFKVHNSLRPKLENDPEENKSGVGLDNVRKRLELLYPNRHELTIQRSEQDYFVALTLRYW